MAKQDLPGRPGCGTCIEDVVNGGIDTRPAQVTGYSDARIGEQRTSALHARPRRLTRGQRRTRQPGETHLRMDLDDTDGRMTNPLLDLEQFRFEPKGLDRDSLPGEIAVDRRGSSVIGGQQCLASPAS